MTDALLTDVSCRLAALEYLTLSFLADSLANDPTAMARLDRARQRLLDRLPPGDPGDTVQQVKNHMERYLALLEAAAHPPVPGQAQP